MGLQLCMASAYVPAMGQFAVTERAAARIAEISAAEGNALALRVSVLAGGCSGFQYRFELDKQVQPDDLVIEKANPRSNLDRYKKNLYKLSEASLKKFI